MNQNKVSATLSDEAAAAVTTALATVKQNLPFLIALSREERRALPKMGSKGRGFVRAALTLAGQNADMLPRAFDVAEFQRDVELEARIAPIAASLTQLAELVDDTLVGVGSDAYVAALAVYGYAKAAGKSGGLDGQLDSLGQRFARRSQSATPAPTK